MSLLTDMRMNKKLEEAVRREREMVEQLRIEAKAKRLPLSFTLENLVKYCETHTASDFLIRGFPKPHDNPFREKRPKCSIV
ncbi:hypothetical protein BaRGS_00010178 [Batillaria attramentaria]|uniref:G protein gamma domain-containing protein n=1 Tax=Batillaria attramentaria TaxID=370345 RepID=A0ABD0LGK7_9CAEN|nr:hypothetical protein BaRGS_003315 [Batillaria attramentaria]